MIAIERPDALLPTMGGQTALNCALDLAKHGVLEKYGVEMIGARKEAIDKAEDREKFKQAMSKIGLASARSAIAHSLEEALQVQAVVGFPTIIRPSFTLGGTGGGIAYNREEFIAICERGLEASPTTRSADRGIGDRLERIRDGSGARPQGQLHHHLLDREPRSDGRAHRRFDHGGAGADADRQGIPDHARRLDRVPARDRRRYRRLQRAVRDQSRRRPHADHRDESARVALVGAGVEGDRFPDRQGRGQARGRLHARRTAQRNHRRRHAGVVRADHRLRRHQGAALRVREISAGERPPDDADEIGRRGDGDRPHVPGVVPEGAARARSRRRRPQPEDDRPRNDREGTGRARTGAHLVRRRCVRERFHARGGSPADRDRSVVPGADQGDRRSRDGARRPRACGYRRGDAARAQAQGLFRPAARVPAEIDRARGPRAPARARHPAGLQARRYLRGGVRDQHRVPVFDLRGGMRGAADRPQEGHRARRRAQSHRPGHRIRLLLRARRAGAARGRFRDHHGQLQSRRPCRPITIPRTGCISNR